MNDLDPRFPSALFDEATARAASQLRDLMRSVTGDEAPAAPAAPVALVVLGSGLADALDAWGPPMGSLSLSDIPGVCAPVADGHRNTVALYRRPQGWVLVASGRTHLYEGASPTQVTALVRAAAHAGIPAAILCNANGCLRDWELGDVMTIEDHVNFSGASPFDGPLFVDIRHVWDAALADAMSVHTQRRGIYALMRGPEYQTMAETRWLEAAGADVVGMSTIMEAITAHALGMRVAGLSVVSDLSFADAPTDPHVVVEAAARASTTVRTAIEAALAQLG